MLIRQGEYRTEKWAQITDFPIYAISTLGRVKNRETGKFLPLGVLGGEVCVRLTRPSGMRVTRKVARLVCEAFLDTRDGYAQIVYRDGDHTNCRVSNLQRIGDEDHDRRNKRRLQRGKEPIAPDIQPKKKIGARGEEALAAQHSGNTPKKKRRKAPPRTYSAVKCDQLDKVWPSIEAMSEELGLNPSLVSQVLRKLPGRKSHHGYTFSYVTAPGHKQNQKGVRGRQARVRVVETGEIYSSVAEMCRKLELDPSAVSAILTGRPGRYTHQGFSFEYVNHRLRLPVEQKRERRIARPLLHEQSGVVYESQNQAARELGLTQANISAHMRGFKDAVRGNTFVYVDATDKEEKAS